MRKALTAKWLIVLLALAPAALPKDKESEKAKFDPGAIADYPNKQAVDNVTVAAAPYWQGEQVRKAFGKLDPTKRGILPVLVLIQNGRDRSITLENLRVELITPTRRHVEATAPQDIKYLSAGHAPNASAGPIPGAPPRVKRKNPLASWEIEGRAFSARMLPPKETASGFFYFRAPHESGSTLYITGLRELPSGRELFYFEVPLE